MCTSHAGSSIDELYAYGKIRLPLYEEEAVQGSSTIRLKCTLHADFPPHRTRTGDYAVPGSAQASLCYYWTPPLSLSHAVSAAARAIGNLEMSPWLRMCLLSMLQADRSKEVCCSVHLNTIQKSIAVTLVISLGPWILMSTVSDNFESLSAGLFRESFNTIQFCTTL